MQFNSHKGNLEQEVVGEEYESYRSDYCPECYLVKSEYLTLTAVGTDEDEEEEDEEGDDGEVEAEDVQAEEEQAQ